jgi:hypothetical protein
MPGFSNNLELSLDDYVLVTLPGCVTGLASRTTRLVP